MHRHVSGVRAGMRADHVRAARVADPIGILELFAGSGYHGEAVCAALRFLGFEPRVLGYVEREAAAACWLLDRMEAAALERAPVFAGDLAELGDGDCSDMRGHVDIIVASPPCQPYSAAGRKRGNADARSHGDGDGPLVHTLRIIAGVRPALVWFENVGEWVTDGHFREFGEELCRMGYDIAPPVFIAAEDVGAPHERERVYILCRRADVVDAANDGHDEQNARGVAAANEAGRLRESAGPAYRVGDAERADARRGDAEQQGGAWLGRRGLADERDRVAEQPIGGFGVGGQPSERDGFTDGRGEQLADERSGGFGGAQSVAAGNGQGFHADAERSGTAFRPPMFPPGRGNDDDELARYVKRAKSSRAIADRVRGVASDFRCWAELLAAGLDPALMPAAESELLGVAHGLDYSAAELLRLCGNGVVPIAVAAAFVAAFRGMQEVTT